MRSIDRLRLACLEDRQVGDGDVDARGSGQDHKAEKRHPLDGFGGHRRVIRAGIGAFFAGIGRAGGAPGLAAGAAAGGISTPFAPIVKTRVPVARS